MGEEEKESRKDFGPPNQPFLSLWTGRQAGGREVQLTGSPQVSDSSGSQQDSKAKRQQINLSPQEILNPKPQLFLKQINQKGKYLR